MAEFECKPCGYIYDEEKGDTENGIKEGTRFGELPDVWVCPLCGVGKDMFEEVKK
ncbi:rubredoxin [Candidatus Woesearchaeota archaeon]|nr:rubredoxin [Candidatus Woesearchaeota archaeon]